jgi:hypothetical protein
MKRPLRFTHAQRKLLGELIPGLADQLLLDVRNTRTIGFGLTEIKLIEEQAREAFHRPANGTVRNSLRLIIQAARDAIENSKGIGAIPAADRLYQFKITLMNSKPPIWRRIQVKDGTLDKLHEHIQTAMGWTNSHLHQFKIDGIRHGDPELLDDDFEHLECIDSTVTKLSEIVPKDGKQFSFLYEYDFGDSWHHEIVFEGCLRAETGTLYPICVEGQRACPPEDVGGVFGFERFLAVRGDPKHAEHEMYAEWGAGFDPDAFDAKEATKDMRRGLPDWRRYE